MNAYALAEAIKFLLFACVTLLDSCNAYLPFLNIDVLPNAPLFLLSNLDTFEFKCSASCWAFCTFEFWYLRIQMSCLMLSFLLLLHAVATLILYAVLHHSDMMRQEEKILKQMLQKDSCFKLPCTDLKNARGNVRSRCSNFIRTLLNSI